MSAGLPPPLQALLDGLSLHGAHELQRALAICLVAPYPPGPATRTKRRQGLTTRGVTAD
jgi:hypothetical protein